MKVLRGLLPMLLVGIFCPGAESGPIGEVKKIPREIFGYSKTLHAPKLDLAVDSGNPIVQQSEKLLTVQPGDLRLRGIIMQGNQYGSYWLLGVKIPSVIPISLQSEFPGKPKKRKSILDVIEHDCELVTRGYGKITEDILLPATTPGQYTVFFCSLKNTKTVYAEEMFEIEVARAVTESAPVSQSIGYGTVIAYGQGTVRVEVSSASGILCKEYSADGKLRASNVPAPSTVRVRVDGVWSIPRWLAVDQTIEFGTPTPAREGVEGARHHASSTSPNTGIYGSEIWWKKPLTPKDLAWLREQKRQGIDDLSLQFAAQMLQLEPSIIHSEGSLREWVSRKTLVHVETQLVGWVDKFTNELVNRRLAELRAEFQQWTRKQGVPQSEVSWGPVPVVPVPVETKWVSTGAIAGSLGRAERLVIKKDGLLSLPLAVVLAGLLTDGPIAKANSSSSSSSAATSTSTSTSGATVTVTTTP